MKGIQDVMTLFMSQDSFVDQCEKHWINAKSAALASLSDYDDDNENITDVRLCSALVRNGSRQLRRSLVRDVLMVLLHHWTRFLHHLRLLLLLLRRTLSMLPPLRLLHLNRSSKANLGSPGIVPFLCWIPVDPGCFLGAGIVIPAHFGVWDRDPRWVPGQCHLCSLT